MGQEVNLNNGQQAIINNDLSNIFLWNRRSLKGHMNNHTYDPVTILAGTVMGRVATSGNLVPFTSGASNGSQNPIGILCADYTLDEGETNVQVYVCDDGDVAAEKLLFQGSDSLDTVVSGQMVRDRLKYLGVKVITADELTGYDNQA